MFENHALMFIVDFVDKIIRLHFAVNLPSAFLLFWKTITIYLPSVDDIVLLASSSSSNMNSLVLLCVLFNNIFFL